MTGDDEGDRILTIRTADSAACAGLAEAGSDLAIGPLLSKRDLPERLPHAQLEWSATQIQAEIKALQSSLRIGLELFDGLLQTLS